MLPSISLLITLLAVFDVALAARVPTPAPPGITPPPKVPRKRQANRKELQARLKHPDLFKRDWVEVSTYETTTCTSSGGSFFGTGATVTTTITHSGSSPAPAKRTLAAEPRAAQGPAKRIDDKQSWTYKGRNVLAPKDLAAFMIGRGVFTWQNGTTYHDTHYKADLAQYQDQYKGTLHRYYNVVMDSLGSKLLEVSVPHFKKWTSTLKDEQMIHLSPTTSFMASDVDDLVQALLEDPDFEDVQYQRFRVNRRFLEVALSY